MTRTLPPNRTTGTLVMAALALALLGFAPPAPLSAQSAGEEVSVEALRARPKRTRRRKKRKKKKGPARLMRWRLGEELRLRVPATLTLRGGQLEGEGSRALSGPFGAATLKAQVALRRRGERWRLYLPIRYSHRETVGYSLGYRDLSVGARFKPSKKTAYHLTGRFMLRPDWPDLYQPAVDGLGQPTGELLGTDRYSYTRIELGARHDYRLPSRWRMRARAQVYADLFAIDPAYDPANRPTHLVPKSVTGGAVSARLRGRIFGGLREQVDARVELKHYLHTFSRDAQTGRTHAGAGGAPPNPYQTFVTSSVLTRTSHWLKGPKLRLIGRAGYTFNADTYEGYYSYHRLELGAAIRWVPTSWARLSLSYSWLPSYYTDSGYAAGGSHLPLDDGGDLRWSTTQRASARLEFKLWRGQVTPFAHASWLQRDTNFPDYEPFVNPASQPYTIDFDYVNLRAEAGVRLRF